MWRDKRLLVVVFILVGVVFFSVNSAPVAQPEHKCKSETANVDAGETYDPENFSKLKLNVRELFGSRFAINIKEAINVSHSIDITDAGLIHDNQLTLRVEFNLRQSWVAPDLEFPLGLFKNEDPEGTFVTAGDNVLSYMWSPDSYVSTARESNMNTIGAPLNMVYIFKNRTIIFKARMFTKVGCTSSFQWYPLDVQRCDLMFESYKYHDNIAAYHWTDKALYRPIVVTMRRLLQYELQLPLKYDSGTIERGGRGKRYPYVRVKFVFERKLGNNIIQVYTPTILVVVLSWFSFWLGLDAVPGRVSLLVTCMLTLVTMHAGIKKTIPPVHYITMMDIWLVCCLALVFSAMFEFVVVKYMHWGQEQKQKLEYKHKQKETHNLVPFMQQIHALSNNVDKGCSQDVVLIPQMILGMVENEGKMNARKAEEGFKDSTQRNDSLESVPLWVTLDKYSRVLFPVLFSLFNVVYWPVLLVCVGKPSNQHSFYNSL